MRKRNNPVAAVIWGAITIFLVVLLISGIRGDNFFGGKNLFNLGTIHIGNHTYGIGTESVDRSKLYDVNQDYTYNADKVNNFKIELVCENLEMKEVKDTDEVTVNLNGNWGAYAPTVELIDNTLYVRNNKKVIYNGLSGNVTISVPSKQYKNLNIENVSGKIDISRLNIEDIAIENVSGSIRVEDCTSDYVSIENVSGSIGLNGALAGVKCENVSGSVKVDSSVAFDRKSSIESVSGSVKLNLPEEKGFSVDYETVSGGVHYGSSLTKTGKKHDGTITCKNGGVDIKIETVSGSISVNY